jgi:hypothetical protein
MPYALCPMLISPQPESCLYDLFNAQSEISNFQSKNPHIYLTTQTVRPRAIWITLLVTLPMKNVLTCDNPRLPITIVS